MVNEAGLDGVLLTLPGNLAWFTGGGRSFVGHPGARGTAELLVSPGGDVLYTDEIEAKRLQAEEFPDLVARINSRPWWHDRERYRPAPSRIGADTALPGYVDAGSMVRQARQRLSAVEIERYRSLGQDSASALTETAFGLTPELTEYQAAAQLSWRLLERGIEPLLLLVAGAERLPLYRHPLPTANRLGGRAMLVAAGCRHGLVASLTRLVSFAPQPAADLDRMGRLQSVENVFLSATRPGRRLGDVFAEGVAAYAEHGFEAEEWHRHHQGGPTGYFGRDEFATSGSESSIVEAQAFAWNPSVAGLKIEDTTLVTNSKLEILTSDATWPTKVVSGRARPVVLER